MISKLSRLLCCGALLFPAQVIIAQSIDWPHHTGTDPIEFWGIIPWPLTHFAAEQRWALAQQWISQLTDTKPTPAPVWTMDKYQLSASNMNGHGFYKLQIGQAHYTLAYQASLVFTPIGMSYRLADFELIYAEEDTGVSWPLESFPVDSTSQVVKSHFYTRLITALAACERRSP